LTGAPPLSVQFTDLTTGYPTKWKWNFGDGMLSTMQNPLHVYGGIGRYTVTLEAENRDLTSIVRKIEFVKASGPKR
jgi:PKD repeat protein